MPWTTRRVPAIAALILLALTAASPAARAQRRPPPAAPAAPSTDASIFSQLRYRYIGPVGNRVTSAAGVPGDPSTYYVGAASGGVWKTTDGGVTWEPVLDEQPVQSIGSLAVAPSDPSIVWAGTGEDCIRSHISIGNGIYKSTDAGKTWSPMGLERTGRIGKIAIDPRNPDVVLACALAPNAATRTRSDGEQGRTGTGKLDNNDGPQRPLSSIGLPGRAFHHGPEQTLHARGRRYVCSRPPALTRPAQQRLVPRPYGRVKALRLPSAVRFAQP